MVRIDSKEHHNKIERNACLILWDTVDSLINKSIGLADIKGNAELELLYHIDSLINIKNIFYLQLWNYENNIFNCWI